ncbi:MAG: hypothetical protein CMJ76_08205 [Planctomycetaceae bacterium]|nr:hypothetical protein [Planctomycetaceae bacterium]
MNRILIVAITFLALDVCLSEETPQAGPLVFETDILPIFQARCLSCHQGTNAKGGLDLSRKGSIVLGGKSGPAIRVSAAESSLLFAVISSGKMPLQGTRLTKHEIGLIRTWINDGAVANDNQVLASKNSEGQYDEFSLDYWSFFPPKRVSLPAITATNLAENAIDYFLLSKLESQGLSYSPAASRTTLIRRLSFDLHGLPPTAEQVEQFVNDDRPDAYEQLVEQFLSNPRYGERWGRHWLDIAGYSDSAGVLSADQDRQLIWRYRDYVIRALNADKPYDQFIRQQLAGDEISAYYDEYHNADRLSAETIEALDATGFLRTGPDSSRPDFNTIKNVNGFYYYPTIDAQVSIVTSSLMGLTLQCAKCHNHKFDPLSQKEYYQLQSILMTVYSPDQWVPFASRTLMLASKTQVDAKAARDAELDTEIKVLNDKLAVETESRKQELFDTRIEGIDTQLRADVSNAFATAEANRTEIQQYLVSKYAAYLTPPADKLQAEMAASLTDFKQLVESTNAEIARLNRTRHVYDSTYAAYDVDANPYTPLLLRGDAQTPGQVVNPGVPQMLQTNTSFQWDKESASKHTSGRRTQFAQWLTQSRHPLTSRVIVNRLWFHHFGEGIVSTLEDFGWAGEDPIHKPLLDWLSVELEDSEWSLKHIHKLILTSQAYRQSSSRDSRLASQGQQLDPQNRLLWRQNFKRLEAEALRDTLLFIAGALDSDMYGFPVGIQTLSSGEVVVGSGALPQRRSIYVRNKRSAPVSILQLFDQPDIETNCIRRSQSTVPLQALSLMNSDVANLSAEAFAAQILKEGRQDLIARAFIRAYGREPHVEEEELLSEFLAGQIDSYAARFGSAAAWSYGTGNVNEQFPAKTEFKPFAHFEKGQWQLGPGYPYMGSMWEGLNATSGHPGGDMGVILRWSSRSAQKIKISGMVNHASPAGDGVRITVISNRKGQLARWVVAHGREDLDLEPLEIEEGEQILLVNDKNATLRSDNFDWQWQIHQLQKDNSITKTWDSVQGFHGPPEDGISVNITVLTQALTDLCHVLLSSNEFSYID